MVVGAEQEQSAACWLHPVQSVPAAAAVGVTLAARSVAAASHKHYLLNWKRQGLMQWPWCRPRGQNLGVAVLHHWQARCHQACLQQAPRRLEPAVCQGLSPSCWISAAAGISLLQTLQSGRAAASANMHKHGTGR